MLSLMPAAQLLTAVALWNKAPRITAPWNTALGNGTLSGGNLSEGVQDEKPHRERPKHDEAQGGGVRRAKGVSGKRERLVRGDSLLNDRLPLGVGTCVLTGSELFSPDVQAVGKRSEKSCPPASFNVSTFGSVFLVRAGLIPRALGVGANQRGRGKSEGGSDKSFTDKISRVGGQPRN